MLKRLLFTSRPIMWPWLMLPYALGVGAFAEVTTIQLFELFLFSLPLNLFLYGVNDAYDYQSDRINARKDSVLYGYLPDDKEIAQLKRLFWIPALGLLITAAASMNVAHISVALVWLFLSFAYSHPWFRFKERFVLDCFVSAAIYTLPGLLAYTATQNIDTFPWHLAWILLPYAAAHAVTALADYEADKAAGSTTTGVTLGYFWTLIFSLLLFITAAVFLREYTLILSILLVTAFFNIASLIIDDKKRSESMLILSAMLTSYTMIGAIYYLFLFNGL